MNPDLNPDSYPDPDPYTDPDPKLTPGRIRNTGSTYVTTHKKHWSRQAHSRGVEARSLQPHELNPSHCTQYISGKETAAKDFKRDMTNFHADFP